MKSAIIFDYISKVSLYALVVLLPVWFLPFTQDMVDYPKQVLLVALVLLGVIAWLAKMAYGGKLEFRKTWLHAPALGLLGAFGLSTIFSLWQYGSFWGVPLNGTDNFLSFSALLLLYVLISQSIPSPKHLFFLFAGFLVSATLAVFFALLQLKGIVLFHTLGNANTAAMLAALLLPLAFAMASAPLDLARGKRIGKGVMGAVVLLLFLGLLLLNFFAAWLVMIAGLAVLAAFETVRQGSGRAAGGRGSLLMALVLVGLFFLIVDDFSIPGAVVKPAEAAPGYEAELRLARSLIAEHPAAALVGTGPGTFAYTWAKFRSPESNQTLFWNARFSSGKAEVGDWLITKGVLSVLFLGLFVVFLAYLLWKKILRERHETTSVLAMGLLALIAGFAASLFLYPANLVLWFVFWMGAGGAACLVGRKRTVLLAERPPAFGFAASFALMGVLVGGAGVGFAGGQHYYAAMAHGKGLQASNEGNIEEAIAEFEAATETNPSVDLYWRNLAQMYLSQANRIATDQTIPQEARQRQTGVAVNNAIRAAQKATEASPNNGANWNVRGFVYRNLIGVPDAERLAAEGYGKARELEPVSPFPWTELGRVKILSSRPEEAIADLQKAVELKPDYAPAHYLLAVAYDQQGKQAEAIAKLEEVKLVAPQDVGLAFQLGVIYYRQSEFGKARDEFERAKNLNLRYSNARYMLGLAYDRLDRRADALSEFTAVAALNPENQEVQRILANLSAGRAALSGIGEPAQPPIAETPEEIASGEQ